MTDDFKEKLKRLRMISCPRRMKEYGPWSYKPNLDEWVTENKVLVCSFCGSIHPGDFKSFCEQALTQESPIKIIKTDKGYKFYVEGCRGGLRKFYTQHMKGLPDRLEYITLVHQAIEVSKTKEI